MAMDEQLAARIRALVAERATHDEVRMFGGLGFLVGGHLAVGVSGRDGLMVRAGTERYEQLLTDTEAEAFGPAGRTMRGWLHVDGEHLDDDETLERWVDLGVSFAASLPPKQG